MKIFEYIGCEIPIISSPKNTEAGKFISKHRLGIEVSNNPREITHQINYIKNNYHLFKKSFSKLKTNEFTRQNQSKKFLKLINNLQI